jgi:hypothetical protein
MTTDPLAEAEVTGLVTLLPDAELERVRAAFLSLHKETCDRCALLGILCDACRAAVGECGALAVIERALKNPPADAEERP